MASLSPPLQHTNTSHNQYRNYGLILSLISPPRSALSTAARPRLCLREEISRINKIPLGRVHVNSNLACSLDSMSRSVLVTVFLHLAMVSTCLFWLWQNSSDAILARMERKQRDKMQVCCAVLHSVLCYIIWYSVYSWSRPEVRFDV